MKKIMKKTTSRWIGSVGTLLMVGASAALLSGCGGGSGGDGSAGGETSPLVSDSSATSIDCSQPYVYPEPTTYANDTVEQMAARHAKERAYEKACGTGGSGSSSGSVPYRYTPPSDSSMTSPNYNSGG